MYGYCRCGECLYTLVRLEGAVHTPVHIIAMCTLVCVHILTLDSRVEYVYNIK